MDVQNLADYLSQAQEYNNYMQSEQNQKLTFEFMKQQAGEDMGLAIPQFVDGISNFVEKAQKIAGSVEKLKGQFQSLPDRMQNIYTNAKATGERALGRFQDVAQDTVNKGKEFFFKTRDQAQTYLEDLNSKTNNAMQDLKTNIMKPIQDAVNANKQRYQDLKNQLGRDLTEEEKAPFKQEVERIRGLKDVAQREYNEKVNNILDNYDDKVKSFNEYAKGIQEDIVDQAQRRATTLVPEAIREAPRSMRDRIRDFQEADPEEQFSQYVNENRATLERALVPERLPPLQAPLSQRPAPQVSEEPNVRPSEVQRGAPEFESPQQQLPQLRQQAEQVPQQLEQQLQSQTRELSQTASRVGQQAEQIVTQRVGEVTQAAQETGEALRTQASNITQGAEEGVESLRTAATTAVQEGTNIARGAISEGSNIAKGAVQGLTTAAKEGAEEVAGSALEFLGPVGEIAGTLYLIGQGIKDLVEHPSAPPPPSAPQFISGI